MCPTSRLYVRLGCLLARQPAALLMMRAIGTAPQRLLLDLLVAITPVFLWSSNTVTAVMMATWHALITQREASERRQLEHFGAALMLGVAYATNMGGTDTKHMFS